MRGGGERGIGRRADGIRERAGKGGGKGDGKEREQE